MRDIVLQLDPAEETRKNLYSEFETISKIPDSVKNIANGVPSWWTGGGAGGFRQSLDQWERQFRTFLTDTQTLYLRMRREEEEWVDVDMSYKYDFSLNPIAMIQDLMVGDIGLNDIITLIRDGNISIKFSARELLAPLLPLELRYPAGDADSGYMQHPANGWIKYESTGFDWDAGLRFAWDKKKGLDAGLFGKITSGGITWTQQLFPGLPILAITSLHGPSAEATIGADKKSAEFNLFDVDFTLGGNVPFLDKFVGVNFNVNPKSLLDYFTKGSAGSGCLGPFKVSVEYTDPVDFTPPDTQTPQLPESPYVIIADEDAYYQSLYPNQCVAK